MDTKKINLEKIPQELKERYQYISQIDYGLLKINCLEEMNKNPLPVCSGKDSSSYEVFANEFNAIMLTAHVFENLLIFEDRRCELDGYNDFQIKIPEMYFQHPSLNKKPSISDKDARAISEVVDRTKLKLNYSKDQSFVLSQLYKLEFISVFSHLEVYFESLLVEFLQIDKNKAAARVRRESLPVLMIDVFTKIDPSIINAINYFDDEALSFLKFCHKLRNLHTHNLGIANEYFYNECLKENFLAHDIYTETSEPVLDYAKLNFKYSSYVIKVGRAVNLASISQIFRLLSREIVYISEVFCKQKM